MSQIKEAMQNTIKSLQHKTDIIHRVEDKGSRTVVLQLGSHTLKIGFATQRTPFTEQTLIAYRRKNSLEEPRNHFEKIEFDEGRFKAQYQRIEEGLKKDNVILESKAAKGKPKAKQIVPMSKLTPFRSNANVLYGAQALWVEDNPDYDFRKPIKHGVINAETQIELQRCIIDIERLLSHLLLTRLALRQSEWCELNCILILPDVFIRSHIKKLLFRLFKGIQFRKIYIHLESVTACFGTAVSSACIVDIGHQKVSVCCVDEGVIFPRTLIRKNYGCKDLSRAMVRLFNDRPTTMHELPGGFRLNSQCDLNQVDCVKELASAIREPLETSNRIYQLYPIRGGVQIAIPISYHDSLVVLSHGFFSSSLWNCIELPQSETFDYTSQAYDLYEDPDDYYQEFSGGGHIFDYASETEENDSLSSPWIWQSLQMLIWLSINSVRDEEMRKKFLGSIMVIGGGAHVQKLIEQILVRLTNLVKESEFPQDKPQMVSQFVLRDIAPIHASWLGGTVIPKLDSLRDLWIERWKFMGEISPNENEDDEDPQKLDKKLFTRKQQSQEWGLMYLKEKVPFMW